MLRIFSFSASWVLIAFAQPDMSCFFSLAGATCGYGLLWYSLESLKDTSLSAKTTFTLLFFWSVTIEAVHFSWMLSDLYVGKFIYAVWLVLIGGLALLFASFSYMLIVTVRQQRYQLLWSFPGVWVAIEMVRFYGLCSGMSLDYLGWPMTACAYGRQFGGFFGWAGQSFAVIATNISFYMMLLKKRQARTLWLTFLLLPYSLGGVHYEYLKKILNLEKNRMNVAVLQPARPPGELNYESPTWVWAQFVKLIATIEKPIDLLVFPEVAVPFGVDKKIYPYEDCLPLLVPFAEFPRNKGPLANIDWLQILAKYFNCFILIGLERWENINNSLHLYNAAELISHQGTGVGYDKRVLVPGGEYIPGGKFGLFICKKFFPAYALPYQRLPGTRPGVIHLTGLPAIGVSICYEETFGHLLRTYKQQGAELLVNLTNDAWYPHSRLPLVHFYHGILRNQELGLPCVRACQTGVTVAADALGRVLNVLPYETRSTKASAEVLQVSIPLFRYKTLYAFCGDFPMVFMALSALGYLGYRLLAKKENG
ncbi:apolipoprotein N-acyltransferase [Candidatus Chlamydia sanziniae]|uniref:Apolipoprotein N-acyltransferase n=1 Tax=Candidatus Chlamydia sanziniae TaxID=1806891 RepID=A0A1A9HUD5_9CHLA|nr:apolipoprotein N-acyltransferase [Candidatus Chlamydia sanziniae]ANH78455.1 Apolipoprotein N-acyltransferase [Candidatus Chlamydia sanziniae]